MLHQLTHDAMSYEGLVRFFTNYEFPPKTKATNLYTDYDTDFTIGGWDEISLAYNKCELSEAQYQQLLRAAQEAQNGWTMGPALDG